MHQTASTPRQQLRALIENSADVGDVARWCEAQGRADEMLEASCAAVLRFWFGDPARRWAPDFDAPRSLWFHATAEIDEDVRAKFGALYESAARGDLDDWAHTPQGAVALVIVLDQFPRHLFRGRARMFTTDSKARRHALAAVESAEELSSPALAFCWICLEHAEDIEMVERAVAGLEALCRDPCTRRGRRLYKNLRRAARTHLGILQRYGRYPHRNELLGRENTLDERAWLAQTRKPKFAASVQPHRDVAPLKLLVLHSFRQSGARLLSRTKAMRAALAPVAELVYVDAPHPYVATDRTRAELSVDFGPDLEDLGDVSHQRCWWNSGDDHTDYEGWEVSFEYLARIMTEQGPFGGVIGFSQGAAAAALFAAQRARASIDMRLVVCISGFASRAREHRAVMSPGGIDVPSLHIYGEQDVLVDNARSQALASCFVDPRVVTHPGGHFVPKLWPIAQIRDFLVEHARPLTTCTLQERVRYARLHHRPIGLAEAAAHLWKQLGQGAQDPRALLKETLADACVRTQEDVLVVLWALQRDYDMRHSEGLLAPLPGDEFHRLFLHALELAPQTFRPWLMWIPRVASWKQLTRLAVYASAAEPSEAMRQVHADIVVAFAEQLALEHEASEPPSDCGVAAPRTQSATQRACGLAGDIAAQMFPSFDRVDAYVAYRRVIGGLSKRHRQAHAPLPTLRAQRRQQALVWRDDALDAPISQDVLRPRPVPVQPCPAEELEPLLEHLVDKRSVEETTAFVRGTHMPDGRLDLCKQVVGPQGIGPVLDGLSDNPHVSRFMIGNNVVGNSGARAIAEFIRSGRSHVDVWYIGGNEIDAQGLAPICEALHDNPHVQSLWLKRNPLGIEGGPQLAALLRRNHTLHTLDLVNTGLLDEGALPIIEALHDNHGLRHLYLGTNGLGLCTARAVAQLLRERDQLRSLFLSCNRLGDEGVDQLAAALHDNSSLVRLGLSSNRLSPRGAHALAEALRGHPSLRFLDLGWTRATAAVGELGNRIADEGARALASMLRDNDVLEGLDVSHNRISQAGIDAISETLLHNHRLSFLRHPQHGKAVNHDAIAQLHARLDRNWASLASREDGCQMQREDISTPRSTREILSVYRTA